MSSMAVPSKSSPNASVSKSSAANSSTSTNHNSMVHNHTPVPAGALKRAAETNSDVKLLGHSFDPHDPPTNSKSETANESPNVPVPDFVTASASVSSALPPHEPNADRIRAQPRRVEGSFDSALVESEVRRIAGERLCHVSYEPYSCKRLSQDLAAELMERLKALKYANYKLVVMVSLGNRSEAPGLQFGSRCLWNAKTDRLLHVKYTNGSIYGVILVYALHFS